MDSDTGIDIDDTSIYIRTRPRVTMVMMLYYSKT